MKFEKIQGLIAATFSPFNPQGELNTTVIAEYANFLYKNGTKGVFINGTTGEGASLTFDEKQILMVEWARYKAPDFKVIAMVAGTSQKEGIALAKLAGETGIYGISVNAPYYVKTGTVTALIDFMEPIAAAAPELAFYFYHIPLLSGVYLPMQELLEQAGRRIPNFAGIKYTHNDLMEFNLCLRYDNYRYDILWGWDEMLLAGLSMGAKGGVGSTYNFAAPCTWN
jgi:N-acetylneuraminate lyase